VADRPAGLAEALCDRYVLERKLGRRGIATVWLARDLRHDRRVALKVFRPEPNSPHNTLNEHADWLNPLIASFFAEQ
jgi:serine/threonine protein kinase